MALLKLIVVAIMALVKELQALLGETDITLPEMEMPEIEL